MASKLFRAVVGFGISLGTVSAACSGAIDDETVAVNSTEPDANSPQAVSDGGPSPIDAAVIDAADGHVADASTDAPKDVDVDAFCDVAWPTTKAGLTVPECVDPTEVCADAGHPAIGCWRKNDAGTCDFLAGARFPICVDGAWTCAPGQSETCP